MTCNRGFYKINRSDLDDRLWRFQRDNTYGEKGFALECVVANLFSAKNYWILKGYNVKKDDGRYYGSQVKDVGIDILVQNGGGKHTVVQCKHYDKTSVGGPDICQLLGSCLVEGTTHGIFVTTSRFTRQCWDIRRQMTNCGYNLDLWDWEFLRCELSDNLLPEFPT